MRHPRIIFIDTDTIQPRNRRFISINSSDVSEHIPCEFGSYTHHDHGPSKTRIYRGPDCMERPIKYRAREAIRFSEIPMHEMKLLTKEQFQSYIYSTTCRICQLEIEELTDKVRDHCHY